MHYKWIELYGYAGIYNGMGLLQMKIDFTKCKTNKVIIRGSNGSGKSTLINAINPNPDSNDKFIPNSEARKNICLVDNGIEYIIRYIHPITNSGRGTTKGYIAKTINGQLVELNPNGNISSCKDILYNEFNLDSNFISLSRLSSEDRGLVDNKPAERKKLINSIINILDTYNGIYKNLSKKSSAFKQIINSLTYKIDYLGNEIQLSSKLKNIENRLSALDTEKSTTIEAIAALKVKISEFMNILRDNNYDSIVKELKDVSTNNKILRNKISNKLKELNISDIDSLDSFFIYLDKEIALIESSINTIQSQITSLLTQRELEYNELENKRLKLKSLQNEYNYIDIKNHLDSSKAIIDSYSKVFNQMGLMNINHITKSEYDSAMEALKYIKSIGDILLANYTQEQLEYVINHIDEINSNIANIPKMRKELAELQSKKEYIGSQILLFDSKQELISELNNRPKECKIDDCPYIKSSLEALSQYPKEEYDRLNTEYSYINNRINTIENSISKLEVYAEIINAINNINRELNSKIKFINKLPIRKDFKETFLTRLINLDPFNEINELYKYIDCGNMIEEYKVAKDQYSKYLAEYKLYEAKNDIIESLISDVESLNKKTNELALNIDELNKTLSDKKKELEQLKSAKTKVSELLTLLKEDLKPSEDKESELLKIKNALDVNSVEINKLQDQLSTMSTNLASVNNDIKGLTEEKDKIKHSLILLNDYKTELKEYSEKYNVIEKVRYYSSPSTGIQTLFMQLYMNKIINVANNLLSLLFDGEFVLQPFIINESEFRIPCLGSGLLHDDISSMSTAQKCMISMILSFSILHQSSTKYNVIMLDELDGGLDTMNRGFFIELLDKLMAMLNCEQCFIISHNNELSTSLSDLIILKNTSGEIYDGNIIWQY